MGGPGVTCRPGARRGLTGGTPLEVVVVLGHVGQDAQPVRHLQGHHVLGVQQGRDAQLLLRHTEGLREGGGQWGGGRETPTLLGQATSSPRRRGRGPRQQNRLAPRKVWFRFAVCSACVGSLASVYPSVQRGSHPDNRIEGAGGRSGPWSSGTPAHHCGDPSMVPTHEPVRPWLTRALQVRGQFSPWEKPSPGQWGPVS